MNIPREVTIYAAGFFDGEGTVSTPAPGGGRPSICCSFAQNSKRPLEYIQTFYGGSIHLRMNKYNGCHQLVMSGENARKFLKDVLPYCLVKDADIKSAFEYAGRLQELTECSE